MKEGIMISEEEMIYINRSGYSHAPYVVTFVNAYEECGAELLTKQQIKRKYKVDVDGI